MQTLDNFNFAGKKAFVRVDFNVPLDENLNITDDTRMRAALPTLKKILADGGSIIIGSHLGRPKKGPEDKFSLKHIVNHLSELLGQPVKFVNDCQGDAVKAAVAELKPGEVLVLENLRFYAEEEGKPRGLADDASDEEKAAAKKAVKESQKEFTKHLAELADVYVNDAFGTAHRAHASTALIADYFSPENKMFGYLMQKEVESVEKVMKNPVHPVTAIIGGSKVSSKITIIENLLSKVDNLVICGGMAFTFAKAMGGKIGNSLCEDDMLETATSIMNKAKELETKIEPRLLQSFKRIRKNSRNGLGIVYVQRDACGGCFNKIPPQRQLDIRSRKKIIVCEYCGRIMIDPELAGITPEQKVEVVKEKPVRAKRKIVHIGSDN